VSTAADAFGAPITETIGGREVVFPRLNMADYAEIEAAVRTERTERVKASAKLAGLDGDRLASFLADRLGLDVTVYDVNASLDTRAGARRALALSLKRAGSDADPESVIEPLGILDACRLAREVVGFVKRKAATPNETGGQPDPL
jgi:hypothetical protein